MTMTTMILYFVSVYSTHHLQNLVLFALQVLENIINHKNEAMYIVELFLDIVFRFFKNISAAKNMK